jgi:integrase
MATSPAGLRDFISSCRKRGLSLRSLRLYEYNIRGFHSFLQRHRLPIRVPRLRDIDRYFVDIARRCEPSTISHAAGNIRSWIRFLHSSGRIPTDLAAAVGSPRFISIERPPKAVPWPMIRRLVRGIDRSTAIGRRDYAQYLLLCAYGLGAGEVIALKLDDIDWKEGTLRILRQKTGNTILLPLLPAAGRAIAAYLKNGRPPSATSYVFPSHLVPFGRCADAGVLRGRLALWARRANVELPYTGTHVFRHSHATRHFERGASLKVIGDILGHRNALTTSRYVRSAQRQLRGMSLPVPK